MHKIKIILGNLYEDFNEEENKPFFTGGAEAFVFEANSSPDLITKSYLKTCSKCGYGLHEEYGIKTLFLNDKERVLPFYVINQLMDCGVRTSFIKDILNVKPQEVARLFIEIAKAQMPKLEYKYIQTEPIQSYNIQYDDSIVNPNKIGKKQYQVLGCGVYI